MGFIVKVLYMYVSQFSYGRPITISLPKVYLNVTMRHKVKIYFKDRTNAIANWVVIFYLFAEFSSVMHGFKTVYLEILMASCREVSSLNERVRCGTLRLLTEP